MILRGAKGYGWYTNYKQKGAEFFIKNVPPTPFNWDESTVPRPKAFFDLSIGPDPVGRIVIELANDVVPKTVENFKLLCTGAGPSKLSYKGSKFHMVNKDKFIMGGDVERGDGTLSHAASKERYIKDENYIIPHSTQGLVRYLLIIATIMWHL